MPATVGNAKSNRLCLKQKRFSREKPERGLLNSVGPRSCTIQTMEEASNSGCVGSSAQKMDQGNGSLLVFRESPWATSCVLQSGYTKKATPRRSAYRTTTLQSSKVTCPNCAKCASNWADSATTNLKRPLQELPSQNKIQKLL